MNDKRTIFRTWTGNSCVRHCAKCKTDENVQWSTLDNCYLCDDCYEDSRYWPKENYVDFRF